MYNIVRIYRVRPLFSDLLSTFLELLYLPQKWSYGTKQGTNRTVRFSRTFWRIQRFDRTYWPVARAVWPPASKFCCASPPPPFCATEYFFFQILKATSYSFTFYLKTREGIFKIRWKTREIWAFECQKSCFFPEFDSFRVLSFFGKLLTNFQLIKKILKRWFGPPFFSLASFSY